MPLVKSPALTPAKLATVPAEVLGLMDFKGLARFEGLNLRLGDLALDVETARRAVSTGCVVLAAGRA